MVDVVANAADQQDCYLKTLALSYVPGVGPKTVEKLARIGIESLYDALLHLPTKYQDRTRITAVAAARHGQYVVLEGQVLHQKVAFGNRRSLVCTFADDTGSIQLRFFHFNQHQQKQLRDASQVRCYGEVRFVGKQLEIIHPEYETGDELPPLHRTLTPSYPLTEGVNQKLLRKITDFACSLLKQYPMPDYLAGPADHISALNTLPNINQAFVTLHKPNPALAKQADWFKTHPARIRLALEELIAHQLSACQFKHQIQQYQAWSLAPNEQQTAAFLAQLPFTLTDAQKRVCDEISADLQQGIPMVRLLQGDVGSGKTVVAALAILHAVSQNKQAALMAPTEILAQQHFATLSRWFTPLGIQCRLLTSSLTAKEKQGVLAELEAGDIQLVIGTHALIQDQVLFQNLALCIIDEQHRFGVQQRLQLIAKSKSYRPHQLMMTATPIPRTMAMTLYADLNVSVIDALPPGRQSIQTVAIPEQKREQVIAKIQAHCETGQQVYWVCPLIEASEALDWQAAEETTTFLQNQLPHMTVTLIHGKMKQADKERVMQAFSAGKIDVLVATTVIEVGVDVPNATLMIIENAERLGLAQLHQLRGRVGRGQAASFCILLYKSPLSQVAKARLGYLRESNDGFFLAEKDLIIRGPGEWLGTEQTGSQAFRIADLEHDQSLVPQAQTAANLIFTQFPHLTIPLVQRWLMNNTRYAAV